MAKQTVNLRVICSNPPSGVFGLQDKKRELIDGLPLPGGRLRFSLEMKVDQTDTGSPNFTGPFAHGSVMERFLYLTQKADKGGAAAIVKRLKVHLKTISWEQVEAALANPDAFLEAEVDGRGAGSVPLLGDGWTVRTFSE